MHLPRYGVQIGAFVALPDATPSETAAADWGVQVLIIVVCRFAAPCALDAAVVLRVLVVVRRLALHAAPADGTADGPAASGLAWSKVLSESRRGGWV